MSRKSRNRAQNRGVSPSRGGFGGGDGLVFASGRLDGGLGDELATRSSLLRAADLDGLPNPDPILRAEGKSLATYRTLVDDHLDAVSTKRYAAVSARSWSLERGKASARTTARLSDMLDTLPVREIIKSGLRAIGYGYSVQEVVWTVRDGWIVPDRLIERPPEWFRFGLRGETRFLDDEGLHPIIPERKLLICRREADALNPYGSPVLSRCFWPLAFKRGGLKLWMLFCERFGLPKTVGRVPVGTSDRERAKLLGSLESMVRAAAAVISDNGKVELLETKVSGDLPFPALVKWADSAMSKAWLGEVLSTETQGTGTYGAAMAANEVRADLALDDAAMIEEQLFGTLVRWIWEVNGLPGPTPWFRIDMPADLQTGRLERDKGLHAMGVRFSSAYFQEIYGLAPEHLVRVDQGGTAASFAAAPQAHEGGAHCGCDHALGAGTPERTDEVLQALLQEMSPAQGHALGSSLGHAVMDMAGRSSGYAEFLDLLDRSFASLDDDQVESVLERFSVLGELAGATDATLEARKVLDGHA